MTRAFNKLAIVGCDEEGADLRAAVRALGVDGVEIEAVIDPDPGRARSVAERLEVERTYDTVARMNERQRVDGVVLTGHAARHADDAVAAFGEKVHVFCDKPFGGSAKAAAEMIRASKRAGRVLGVGYHLPRQARWSVRFAREGGIGTPRLLEARSLCSAVPEQGGDSSIWQAPDGRGAGAELGADLISVALAMIGVPANAVTARGWWDHRYRKPGLEHQVEDSLHLVVDFVTEARAAFTTDWRMPGEEEHRITCRGSEGWLSVPLPRHDLDPVGEAEGDPRERLLPKAVGPEGASRGDLPLQLPEARIADLRNWVDTCRGDEELLTPADEIFAVHQVLDAAYESSRRGGERIWI